MEMKCGYISWFLLTVLYVTVQASPLPYCKDQWRDNMYGNVSATGPCKIEQKIRSVVDMYCDVDSSTFSSISWFHKFRGEWVPLLMENDPDSRPAVYLTGGNKNLTLLSTYIDSVDDKKLDKYSRYNKNTDGLYMCKAVSDSDHAITENRTIELELYDCAKRKNVLVHLTLSEVLTDLGGNVTSACLSDYGCTSVEPFSADWFLQWGHNYTKISDLKDSRFHVTSNISNAGRHIVSTLTIGDIRKPDFGDGFVCIVQNASNTVIKRLRIKRVDVVNKHSPIPWKRVLIPVLCCCLALVCVTFLLVCSRYKIGLYIKSRYYDANPQNTNKVFIFYDEEEDRANKDVLSLDVALSDEISEMLGDNYEVQTSYTVSQPGQERSSRDPYKGLSTIIIILPMDITTLKEMDSNVSLLYKSNTISLRYLTVIDRSEENLMDATELEQPLFLLSKSLVHLTRPAKHHTEKQKELFYDKLKKRTAPLPQNQKAQEKNVHQANICVCYRRKTDLIYALDNRLLGEER